MKIGEIKWIPSPQVTVENAECGVTGVTCYKLVEINIDGVHIKLLRGVAPTINGEHMTSDEYHYHGVHITKAGLWTFVYIEKFDLMVQYDEGNLIIIHL